MLEQGTGIEPAFTAWEAVVLPIYEPCGYEGIIAETNGDFNHFLSSSKMSRPCKQQGRSIFRKFDDVIRRAAQHLTELFQGVHRNAFVSFQVGDGISAESQLVDQSIGRDPTVFHGCPQRFIADHVPTPLSCRYKYYLMENAA